MASPGFPNGANVEADHSYPQRDHPEAKDRQKPEQPACDQCQPQKRPNSRWHMFTDLDKYPSNLSPSMARAFPNASHEG